MHDAISQEFWNDTVYHTVDLRRFKTSKKIVRIEYGRITAFVNQKDYFGAVKNKDTIRITPKFLDDWKFIALMEKGKVKLYRITTESYVNKIQYRFKKIADILQFFEFEDSTVFFVQVRAHVSLFSNGFHFSNDSISKDSIRNIVRKKEFEYPEEFPATGQNGLFKIKDYFPGKKNNYYVYDNGNRYEERYTFRCKATRVQRKTVFYFRENYDKYNVYSIDYTHFGDGIYYFQNDSIYTIAVGYEKEIKEADTADAKLFLPTYLKIGDSTARVNSVNRKVITLLKQEDLNITNKVYKDCLKFKQLTYWNDTIYLSYFWLHKNTGLVKWMRDTGREDVLINMFRK
jgi:hypothetical protein